MFSSCDQSAFNEASAPLSVGQMIECNCVLSAFMRLFGPPISDPISPVPTVSKQSLPASGF